MSKAAPTIDSLDDLILGVLGSITPPSQNVDKAVRLCSTWSGNDKLLMVVQYGIKLLARLLQARAELQFRAGKRAKPISLSKEGLGKFASQISLTRRVSGFWGLLAIIKGISAIERARPSSRLTLNLQRIQAISMVFFYPLDYISFFSSPLAPLLRNVSPETSAKAGLWSVRAWGVYVAIQVGLLARQWKELDLKEQVSENQEDRNAATKKKRDVVLQLVANVTRMPVILHWSLIGGLYKNDIWTELLSFISGVAAFQAGWEAITLPPPKY